LFRGALDVRAKTITDGMCFAAAESLAASAGESITAERLLPTMDDWEVFPREAADVGMRAQKEGVARIMKTWQELFDHATTVIRRSRGMTANAMERGDIPAAPDA
jgi:malate dehydrogenase (oxaloacetate-decarboxylating)